MRVGRAVGTGLQGFCRCGRNLGRCVLADEVPRIAEVLAAVDWTREAHVCGDGLTYVCVCVWTLTIQSCFDLVLRSRLYCPDKRLNRLC